MKTLADIEAALSVRYDGPIEQQRGFDYIPWNESARQANKVFGINGYDVVLKQVKREGAGYMAVVAVTVKPSDAEVFTREGVGYSDVQTTKDGRELVDTAIKGAASDAFSRACKLFGDAFGLYLYDKGGSAPTSSNTARTTNSTPDPTATKATGPLGYRPSPAQQRFLSNLGWTPELVAMMPASEWKAKLDNKSRYQAPAVAAVAPTPQASSDGYEDLDEFLSNN